VVDEQGASRIPEGPPSPRGGTHEETIAAPYTSLKAQQMMDTLQAMVVDAMTDAVQRTLKPD
jgi:hypothetical protein